MDFNAAVLNDLPRLTSIGPPNFITVLEQEKAKPTAASITPGAETQPRSNCGTEKGAEQTGKDGDE